MDNKTIIDVEMTKKLIEEHHNDKNLEDYSPYKSVYLWTNEDIRNTLRVLKMNNKERALCVLSSGDHLFNLLVDGYKEVDTYDINMLAEYTSLGLKRAMIIKYPYLEFKYRMDKIQSNSYSYEEEIEEIIGCFDYMEEEHKLYFMELIDSIARKEIELKAKDQSMQHLLDHLLKKTQTKKTDYILGNNYLDNEINYEILRDRLKNTTINFIPRNILRKENKRKKYDFIHLSNILDYAYLEWGKKWKYNKLLRLEKNLSKELNEDGLLLIYYIFQYFEDLLLNDQTIHIKRKNKEELITFKNAYQQKSAILVKKLL